MERITVELDDYPDLVVIYLGMRVNSLRGLPTLLGFGSKIASAIRQKPDGLLAHESIVYSLFPLHVGMRQYWRDFDSLEAFSRAEPHRTWWKTFLKDPKGTGFWHEAYFRSGGMEAMYVNVPSPFGFRSFAPNKEATGAMFTSRQRAAKMHEQAQARPPVYSEEELYSSSKQDRAS